MQCQYTVYSCVIVGMITQGSYLGSTLLFIYWLTIHCYNNEENFHFLFSFWHFFAETLFPVLFFICQWTWVVCCIVSELKLNPLLYNRILIQFRFLFMYSDSSFTSRNHSFSFFNFFFINTVNHLNVISI